MKADRDYSSKTIFIIDLQAGTISITRDEVGAFLEVNNGEESIEALITMKDLRKLWHAANLHEDEIVAASGEHSEVSS